MITKTVYVGSKHKSTVWDSKEWCWFKSIDDLRYASDGRVYGFYEVKVEMKIVGVRQVGGKGIRRRAGK